MESPVRKNTLQAINLYKTYGQIKALENLNFKVSSGEVYCLLGQNGAGKTTTINIILGMLRPTSGEVLINGVPIETEKSRTKEIAYIPEVVQLYGTLTGSENLDYFSRLAGQRHTGPKLKDLLIKAGLQADAIDRPLETYSKGMRQKVGIAIALSKNASFILMDEPTSGLDPKATEEFSKLCISLSDNGVGIFMATHDIFNAVNIGSRIGIMNNGSIVHETNRRGISPEELQKLYLKTI